MQIIRNTIRCYSSNPRKLDYILKRTVNERLNIKCVGAGVGDRGTIYLLFVATEDFFSVLNDFNMLKNML